MSQVLLTPEAEQDLVDIVHEIANDRPGAAIRRLNGLEHVFHLLSTQPLMGERYRRRGRSA